jgi:hypothetical protein
MPPLDKEVIERVKYRVDKTAFHGSSLVATETIERGQLVFVDESPLIFLPGPYRDTWNQVADPFEKDRYRTAGPFLSQVVEAVNALDDDQRAGE